MAITPDQAKAAFSKRFQPQFQRLEAEFDELLSKFAPNPDGRHIIDADRVPGEFREDFMALYRAAGWSVSLHIDERDDAYFIFRKA